MSLHIDRVDHLVLTVADIDATVDFYTHVLGMERVEFAGRTALRFGEQKIHRHEAGHAFEPKAARPAPGSGDLCWIARMPLDDAIRYLSACGVAIELGPAERTGALGAMWSAYLRDPDGNPIELSHYASSAMPPKLA